MRAGERDVRKRAIVSPRTATQLAAMMVSTTFVINPRRIFGSTSAPYTQLKKVSERLLKPGEVTSTRTKVPRTSALEKAEINPYLRAAFRRNSRRFNSRSLGTQSDVLTEGVRPFRNAPFPLLPCLSCLLCLIAIGRRHTLGKVWRSSSACQPFIGNGF